MWVIILAAASLAVDLAIMTGAAGSRPTKSHELSTRIFLPCGESDAVWRMGFFHFAKKTLRPFDAHTASSWRTANAIAAGQRCVASWSAAERRWYLTSSALPLFLLVSSTSDNPVSAPVRDIDNQTLTLTDWSRRYPHVHLVVANCRAPLFRVGRDVCVPVGRQGHRCAPPAGAANLTRVEAAPHATPKYRATFKGTLYSEGPGAVRMLLPYWHRPDRGVVSVVACRCPMCDVRARNASGASAQKKKATALKAPYALLSYERMERDYWLLPPRWCEERLKEYRSYTSCDLLNTTFGCGTAACMCCCSPPTLTSSGACYARTAGATHACAAARPCGSRAARRALSCTRPTLARPRGLHALSSPRWVR